MTYSIPEAKSLCERWQRSESICRIVWADVATGGSAFGLITNVSTDPPTELSVTFETLLPNGTHGEVGSLDVHFWGSEEMEFTDFTGSAPDLLPVVPDLERVNSCLNIRYENSSMLSICEAWNSPEIQILRGAKLPADQLEAMLKFFNEHQNKQA